MAQSENNRFNDIFDVILKDALQQNQDELLQKVPPEEELRRQHRFSPKFRQRMSELFSGGEEENLWEAADTEENPQEAAGEKAEGHCVGEKTEESLQGAGAMPENSRGVAEIEEDLCGAATGEKAPAREKRAPVVLLEERRAQRFGEKGQEEPAELEGSEKPGQEDPGKRERGGAEGKGESGIAGRKKESRRAREPRGKKRHRRWKLPAAAAAIIVVAFFALWQFEPIRASVVQTFLNFGGDGIFITNGREDDYDNFFKTPSYMPKGYAIVFSSEGETKKCLEYSDGDHAIQITYAKFGEDYKGVFDNERHTQEAETVVLNKKYNALAFCLEEDGEMQMLTWQDGEAQYKIVGEAPMDELVKIAESIMK